MAEVLKPSEILNRSEKNFKVDYGSPNIDRAIFLPSISSLYARHVSKKDEDVRNGNCPKGMKSIKDLDFLNPEKGIYWYPWALYSAGHAQLDLIKTDVQEEMIQKRDRSKTFILADSGGYQLSTGVLKGNIGDMENMAVDENTLRHKIMKWMEHTADFSMILDMPTTSIRNEKSFIYKRHLEKVKSIKNIDEREMFYDCLYFTLRNCEYFMKHRTVGKTKFLNVLQGRDLNDDQTGENDIWYNVVKYFNDPTSNMAKVKTVYQEYYNRYVDPNYRIEITDEDQIPFGERAFEGWAIPGNLKFNFQMMMKRFRHMYNDGFLKDTGKTLLIHFLGISRINAGLLYTTLQREMQKKINPNLIITYDAASPFVCTAKGKGYAEYTINNKKMSYKMTPLPDGKKHHHYHLTKEDKKNGKVRFEKTDKWVQDYTTLGEQLIIKDICCKDRCLTEGTKAEKDEKLASSSWDGTSYVYIMNMNVEQHIKGIQDAHIFYDLINDGFNDNFSENIPFKIITGKLALTEIVNSGFDLSMINHWWNELENLVGLAPDEPNAIDNNSLFEIDKENSTSHFYDASNININHELVETLDQDDETDEDTESSLSLLENLDE